MINLLLLFLI